MLTVEATQQINLLMNAANAEYNAAAARNDHATAVAQADLINCYRAALNSASFVPWTGYTLPTNCATLAPITLSPATTTPGQLVQPPPNTTSNAGQANGPDVLTNHHSVTPAYITDCLVEEVEYCCYYPSDPACVAGFSPGGPSSAPIINNYYDTYVTNNYTTGDASLADVNNLVDGALSSLWSVVVSAVDSTLVALVAALQAAVTSIANALKSLYSTLARLAGLILKALQTIWQSVVKALATLVHNLITLIRDLWDKVIVPLMKALVALRKWLLELYQRYIRPILIVIQHIRQVLAVLRILHVKWAGKLDQVLSDIQSRLTAPLFFLLSYANALANWINLIVTAGYLLQRPLWLASLNAYKGATVGLIVNSMTNSAGPPGAPGAAAANSLPSTAASNQAGLSYMQTGTGPYQSLIDAQSNQLQQYLNGGL